MSDEMRDDSGKDKDKDKDKDKAKDRDRDFAGQIGAKAARKIKARRSVAGIWFGLGMMGVIGWAIVVPTLLGAALGLWLDSHYRGPRSWTLALLVGGLVLGCFNAWRWVEKEDKAMRDEQMNVKEPENGNE
jgi:ATP synthase protein I